MNLKVIIGLFMLLTVFVAGCHPAKHTLSVDSRRVGIRAEHFDRFYERFHSDSLFQVSRTRFPMGGMLVEGNRKIRWTRENLPLMKVSVFDIDTTQYKVSIKKTADAFTQRVWLEDSGFSSECRFELIDNKWYLVYVLDENY